MAFDVVFVSDFLILVGGGGDVAVLFLCFMAFEVGLAPLCWLRVRRGYRHVSYYLMVPFGINHCCLVNLGSGNLVNCFNFNPNQCMYQAHIYKVDRFVHHGSMWTVLFFWALICFKENLHKHHLNF